MACSNGAWPTCPSSPQPKQQLALSCPATHQIHQRTERFTPCRAAQRGHRSIDVAAPPDLVYDLIADVTRMGQWSPECYRCDWLDGATAAAPGTRFRGYNRLGRYRWERTAIIDTADRGSEFTFTTTDDRTGRLETQWQYTMQPTPSGTLLTESFEFLWCSLRNRATEMFIPRRRQVNRGIEETLTRIKRAAEALQAGQVG